MKKKHWLYVLLPLLISWSIDRITKEWASHLAAPHFFGFFGFVLHHNSGAIMGLFSTIPAILRIVSLSTGGAFLLFLFGIIQFLLPGKNLKLRIGLSLLISGIIGNVTDRIIWGYVVDFIVVGRPSGFSPAFNFADAIQWVGYFYVLLAFIKDGHLLWPADNTRKGFLINPRFQLKYCFMLVLCGLGLTVITGTYSFTYMKVALTQVGGLAGRTYLGPFVMTFGIVSLTFCAVLFAVGIILSHRAAGPLYAFERFLDDYIAGKQPKLKLRAGDEFKQLEALANKMMSELNPKSSRSKSG